MITSTSFIWCHGSSSNVHDVFVYFFLFSQLKTKKKKKGKNTIGFSRIYIFIRMDLIGEISYILLSSVCSVVEYIEDYLWSFKMFRSISHKLHFFLSIAFLFIITPCLLVLEKTMGINALQLTHPATPINYQPLPPQAVIIDSPTDTG
jgi:hypothetical protein